MKGKAGACSAYIFPNILYRLVGLPLCKNRKKGLDCLLTSPVRWSQVSGLQRDCCPSPVPWMGVGDQGPVMPQLLCYPHASRLVFLRCALTEDSTLEGSIRDNFPSITLTMGSD